MIAALRSLRSTVLATRTLLIRTLIAATALIAWQGEARATHAMGGDLTYQALGGNLYKVTLKFYRDCNGVAAPTNCNNGLTFNVTSSACSANFDQCLSLESVQVITPICVGELDRCNSASGTYGVEEYTFSKIIDLTAWAGCGTDWIISWALCCRNDAITSLNQPGSRSLYLDTRLNNTVTPHNNSPVFLTIPTPFYCVGQQISYNPGAFDPDGDSLAYSIIQPRTVNNATIPFAATYSLAQPIHNAGGAGAVQLNATTGTLTCIPDIQQVAVVTYRVREFRNGVQIGAVSRDVQFVVRTCSGNTTPTVLGINGTNNYSTSVCVGQPISFTVPSNDANAGQTTTLTWNNGIPGGSFVISGSPFQTGTFTWTPTIANLGLNVFTVSVEDNACPLVGTSATGFSINVTAPFAPADAGPDLEACGSVTMLATLPLAGPTTSWTVIQGAGTFSDQGPNAFVTGLAPGTNIFQWNVDYGTCGTSNDQVTVINYNNGQQAANAGPDQDLCATTLTTNLAGNAANTPAVGTWTLVSGTGTIASPNSPTSQVSNLGPGQNRFRWSIDNGPCNGVTFDDVFITVYPVLGNANAGPDASLCTPNTDYTMNASAANFPASGQWTTISGGGAIFNGNSPTTLVGGIPVGVNTYQWTVNNGPCGTTNDQITITVYDENSPSADAGPDQQVCATSATLAGNTPTFPATGSWTLISGSGTITTANSPTSGVTGLGVGNNVFQWTVNNGVCANGITTDQVTITRFDATAPTANAGPDQSVCSSTAATVMAANTPAPPSTGTWTLVSGTATIANASSPTTGVSGLSIGTVVLRWTIDNGPCGAPTNDLVTITVYDENAVTANAGPDQTRCLPNTTATLAGNVPTSPSTGTWTLVSGAGAITTPNAPASGVTGLGVGANVFQWTINNGACANPISTDQVTITVFDNGNVAANAGTDQNICSTTSSVTLTGSALTPPATGNWTLISGTGTIATPNATSTVVTGLSVGENVFQWNVNNGACGNTNDQVSVFVYSVSNPVANAGPDQSFCTPTTNTTLAGSTLTFPATGTWSLISGSATFGNASSPTSTVSGLGIGGNVLRWTVNNGPCGGSFDEVTIFIYDQSLATANAGADQSICSTTPAVFMGASPLNGVATGNWSLVSGSGTITAPNSPFTSITGLAVGQNIFQWSVNNGPCGSSSDLVSVFVFDTNNPVANAGPDVSQCTPFTSVAMAGSSLTFPATGTWTVVSGSGTIANPASPTTLITNLGVGTNTFQWTVSNGPCGSPTNDQVSITIFDANAQAADAGADQSICSTTATVNISGNAPVGSATGEWNLIQGTATITDPNSPNTTLTSMGVGEIIVEWSIDNGSCGTSSDQMSVFVFDTNNPIANAGADQSHCTPISSAPLLGSNVIFPATGFWSLISGTGAAVDPTSPTTTVNGLSVGANVFQWTVNNGPCNGITTDQVTIFIFDANNPVANAGPDQQVCAPQDSAFMAGSNVIFPATGVWSLISGSGTFADPADPNALVAGLSLGENVFRWTVSNGPCGAVTTDFVTITLFDEHQDPANAGADQSICVPTFPNSVTLIGSVVALPATGEWTLVSGTGTIASPTTSTTQIDNLDVGINVFAWTINNGPCEDPITTDEVTVFVFDAANPIANAGPDQNLCTPIDSTVMAGSNLIVPATGTWTLISGTGIIVDPSDPNTSVYGLTVGANVFQWTVSNGPCLPGITSDQVTINVFNGSAQTANAGPDQNLCSSTLSTVMAGNPASGLAIGTWTVQQGQATFTNPNLATTTVTGLGIGVNILVWSIDNGACGVSSDVMTLNVYDANQPAANAGVDQNICIDIGTATTTMSASAVTIPGTGTWTLVQGSGVFADASDPNTSISGISIGVNLFRWTVTNGPCVPPSSNDVVAVTVYDSNSPVANAGPDKFLCTPTTFAGLGGSIPIFPATGVWTVVQGAGTFSDPVDPNAVVSDLAVGENILQWTVTNGVCANPVTIDQVSIFIYDANNPVADAGVNARLCTPEDTYIMQGSSLIAPATGLWTLISGTGNIVDPSDPNTLISGLTVGVNTFEWTVDNGPCGAPTSAQMTITVFDENTPLANAGPDQNLCSVTSANLSGSLLIFPATGQWTLLSGTGTFGDVNDPNTSINGISVGTTVVMWEVFNGPCSPLSSDTMTINLFDSNAPAADAGPDQDLCSDLPATTLAANAPVGVAVGTWTVLQGTAFFGDINDPNSSVSGLSIGQNILEWTIDNGVCGFSSDFISIFVYDQNNPNADAGADQNLCTPTTTAAMSGSPVTYPAVGLWTLVSGSGTITDANSPTTTITDLGVGANVFQWTVDNGVCANGITTDQVTINVFDDGAAIADAGPDQDLCTPTNSAVLSGNTTIGVSVGTWSVLQGAGTFSDVNDPNATISGLGVGETIVEWSIDNGPCGSSTDQMSIFLFDGANPDANAGADQELCTPTTSTTLAGSSVTFPAQGTWTLVQGTGVLADENDPNSGVTGLSVGENIFAWTVDNGPCANGITTDQVSIFLFDENNPVANAGADQELCSPLDNTDLAGSNVTFPASGTWTVFQGTGVFADANDPLTNASGLTIGENIFVWTVSNGPCANGLTTDTVSIFLFDENNPVADAGPDQELCTPNTSTALAGSSVTFPAQGTWTLVQGTGAFADANDPNTTVTGLTVGENIFQWSVSNGPCADPLTTDQVSIFVFDENNPVADAGPDQELCTPNVTTTLAGSAVTFPASGSWTLVSGTGTFVDFSSPNTTVTDLSVGANVFAWTVSNGPCANPLTSDTVTIFLFDDNNLGANAGPDQDLCTPNTTTDLAGSAVTFPATGTWTLIQGTGLLADATDPNTNVSGLSVGENIFEWSVSNGPCDSSATADQVSIFVFEANMPVADAGPDQELCTPADATTLAGSNVIFPAVGTWSLVSGTGTPVNVNDPNTTVNGLTIGENVFAWTVDNGPCGPPTSDTVSIFLFDEFNPVANAGPDQSLCDPSTTAQLAGSTVTFPASGTWTVIAGTGTFSDANDPNTTINGLSIGLTTIVWTVYNGPCLNGLTTDTLDILLYDDANPNADAGPDQELCEPNLSTNMAGSAVTFPATGTWTLVTGTGLIAGASDPNTLITGLTVGENIFLWTVDNGPCANGVTTDLVSIFVFDDENPDANAGPDQQVCTPITDATLSGSNVIFPAIGTWTLASGQGTITDPNFSGTEVTNLGIGPNVFVWTVDNGACLNGLTTDSVMITLFDLNAPPADAGADQQLCQPDTTTILAGNTPTPPGTGAWSLTQGTGDIVDATDPNSAVTGLTVGENIFVWTVDNGICGISNDSVSIFIFDDDNPAAYAGEDVEQCVPQDSIYLQGNTPIFPAIGTWSVIDGAGLFEDVNDPNTKVVGLAIGANTFVWTVDNGPCLNPITMDTMTVILYSDSTAPPNAGPDLETCLPLTFVQLLGETPMPPAEGTWSLIGGTGNIVDPTNPQTVVNGLTVGISTFVWTLDLAPCPNNGILTDTVQVYIYDPAAPTANAGPDQELCTPDTTTFFEGNVPSFPGEGTWSLVAGTGVIDSIHVAGSYVSGLSIGVNTFVWTIYNGQCGFGPPSVDTVNILVFDANAPLADAGTDQQLCTPNTTTGLEGNNATFPGTGQWTQIQGTGTINTPDNPQTLVSNLGVGDNLFVWTIDNGACGTSTDTALVQVFDGTQQPADAGPDQEICIPTQPNTVTMAANAAIFPATGSWSVVSGTATIVDPTSPTTEIQDLEVGIVVLAWTIDNGPCGTPTTDQVIITIYDAASPAANAGPDQDLCLPTSSTALTGNSPIFPSTGVWTLISGSGTITDANDPTSNITGLAAGITTLIWTIDNGPCATGITNDTLVISVYDNQAGSADAGPDQSFCSPIDDIDMAANIPTIPAIGTWTLVSGSALIGNVNDPSTVVSDVQLGETVLQWSIDNGPCGTSDDLVSIFLWDGTVPPAYAGEDQSFCEDTTETSMHAAPVFSTATAEWTLLSGSGTIVAPTDSLTAITGLQLGPNIFLWTVYNGECGTTSDSLVITIDDCTDFIVPDAFSPNDDGRNDNYVISGLEAYPDAHLQVFNRWGSQVLDRQPYLNNWDGRSENPLNFGEELPESTYYYILDLGDGSEILTGYIYLRR